MKLSTTQPKGWGLLEVHPEPCFPTPPLQQEGGASHGRTGGALRTKGRPLHALQEAEPSEAPKECSEGRFDPAFFY